MPAFLAGVIHYSISYSSIRVRRPTRQNQLVIPPKPLTY